MIVDAIYQGSLREFHGPCCVSLIPGTGKFVVAPWVSTTEYLQNVSPESLDFFANIPRGKNGECGCGENHPPVSIPHGLILDNQDEEI